MLIISGLQVFELPYLRILQLTFCFTPGLIHSIDSYFTHNTPLLLVSMSPSTHTTDNGHLLLGITGVFFFACMNEENL